MTFRSFPWFPCLSSLLISLPTLVAREKVLEDFQGESLSRRWQASGPIQVARENAPDGKNQATPDDKSVKLSATGRAVFLTKEPEEIPGWNDAETLRFRVYQKEKAQKPLTFDLLAMEGDRKAMFWRKIELPPAQGWSEISLPLAWFRWEDGRVPRWKEIRHWGIRTRDASEFWLDDVALVDDDPAVGAHVSPESLAALAFGKDAAPREFREGNIWILTDAPELDLEKLGNHLLEVRKKIFEEIPLEKLRQEGPEGVLLVFGKEEDYRGFVPRLGRELAAQALPPESDGYHLMGYGLSFYDPAQGALRPVFTHEFTHSVLSNVGGIDSSGNDWLQEAVANHIQLIFHPQDLKPIIQKAMDNPGFKDPLETLVKSGDVSISRYWQVVTFLEMLLSNPGYREGFAKMLPLIQQSGNTDITPHLPIWDKDWAAVEKDWENFCRGKLAETP